MPPMSLSDSAIRSAKPKEKAYKLFDGQGLYLEVAPIGSKYWRLKYRFAEKEKRFSIIDAYTGNIIVRAALRLAPYVFVRPGELRRAEWIEFDIAVVEGVSLPRV